MIHRKKNRPALQRHDILTVSLVDFSSSSFFFFLGGGGGLIEIFFKSSSTQFLVFLFF